MPAQSRKHAVSPKAKITEPKCWTRTFPIFWDMTVTRRKYSWRSMSEQTKTNTVSRSPIASCFLKCRSSLDRRSLARNLILSQIISGYPKMRLASMSHVFFCAPTPIKFDISRVPQLLGVPCLLYAIHCSQATHPVVPRIATNLIADSEELWFQALSFPFVSATHLVVQTVGRWWPLVIDHLSLLMNGVLASGYSCAIAASPFSHPEKPGFIAQIMYANSW